MSGIEPTAGTAARSLPTSPGADAAPAAPRVLAEMLDVSPEMAAREQAR